MDNFIKEIYENDLYKLKHISGINAEKSAKSNYHSTSKLILSYCIKGGGDIIIDGSMYKINDGDLFIMKPSEFFRHIIDNNCFHERIVLITSVQLTKNLPSDFSGIFSPFYSRKKRTESCIPNKIVSAEGLGNMFNELLELCKSENPSDKVLSFAKVLQITGTVSKIITKGIPAGFRTSVGNEKVNDIMKYLNANYNKNISIEDVACHFNMNRTYLSKMFKEHTGMSIWEYVISRRIYLFNYLIKDSNSTEETAYKAGFRNYSNFYRLYKKYMLMTPTEFKNIDHFK